LFENIALHCMTIVMAVGVNDMEIRNRVAIVTGGSSDLGEYISRKLAVEGVHVVVVYHSGKETAEAFSAELAASGVQSAAFGCDVSSAQQVEELIEQVVQRFGSLSILVNGAAITDAMQPTTDITALSPELWDRTLQTNTSGPFYLIRAAVPAMKASGFGRIVNIASSAGLSTGGPLAYAVSKAALMHLTRCLAPILGPEISINCIAPGMVDGKATTERFGEKRLAQVRQMFALKRGAAPEDIAEQAMTFIRSDSTTGQTLVIDGGRTFH
jgi:3-oxoacyl-[acyl-carrier protein] reductase